MRRLLSAALVLLSATASHAERPSTLAMTCRQAQALVASRGAVVLSTGTYTYDRFVAHGGYCALGEYADNGFAPTRDTRQCRVGYVCKSGEPPWEDFFEDGPFGRR